MTMAAFDLSDYTLSELKGLLFDIDKEIARRRRDEDAAVREQARERILAIVQDAGLSVEQLLDGARPADTDTH